MDWQKLKATTYAEDDSYRDIYVKDTTFDDWLKLAKLLNTEYHLKWYNPNLGKNDNKIDMKYIADYWRKQDREIDKCIIRINNIQINLHFFDIDTIEFDFDPNEVRTPADHDDIMDFMIDVSNKLNKPVILTPENQPDYVLLKAKTNKIIEVSKYFQ